MSLVDFEEKFRVSLGRSAQNELNVLEESAPAASGGTRYTTTYFVLYAGLEKRTFASPTMTIEKEKQVELEQSSRVDKPNALALPKSLQVFIFLTPLPSSRGSTRFNHCEMLVSSVRCQGGYTHTWLISAIVSSPISLPVRRLYPALNCFARARRDLAVAWLPSLPID